MLSPLRAAADAEEDLENSGTMRFCIRFIMDYRKRQKERVVLKWGLQRRHGIFFGDARGRVRVDAENEIWAKECIGGVLFINGHVRYFVAQVTDDWDRWMGTAETEGSRRQIINIAEGRPFLLALEHEELGGMMAGADMSVYIDNAAAEWTLRKPPASSSKEGQIYLYAISGEVWRQASEKDIRIWVWRVPSALNCADPLSRKDERAVLTAKWKKVEVALPTTEKFWWVKDLLLRARELKSMQTGRASRLHSQVPGLLERWAMGSSWPNSTILPIAFQQKWAWSQGLHKAITGRMLRTMSRI